MLGARLCVLAFVSTLSGCGALEANGDVANGSTGSGGNGPNGANGPTCREDQTRCAGACVALSSDRAHCGACGIACATEEVCTAGRCAARQTPAAVCEAPIGLVDTSAPDHVVGTGAPASCTHEALAAAVGAGGVIAFDCGPSETTIAVTEALTLRTDVDTVIDGGGTVTLDGGRLEGRTNRIFEYHSPDYRRTETLVVLQRLTLRNAAAPTGDFTPQSPSNPDCAWGYKDGEGGAIRVRDGRLHVIDSTFVGNRAAPTGPDTGGGAIYAVGALEVVVVGSAFIDNEGSNGGAVGLLQSDGVFVNTTFENNRATGTGQNFGGATGCPEFNHAAQGGAGGNGGALVVDGGDVGRLDLCGTVFRGNRGNELGTVFRTPNTQRGRSTFHRCLFENNHAGDGGGALWMQDMALEVTASAVVGNTSDGLGAGIRLDQGPHGSTLLLENTTLQGNVATESLGGGLVFAGTGTVRNCTFADNRADGGVGYFGAAIVAHGPDSANLEVTNTIFSNNLDDHEWTPMTCSIGNAGDPSTLAGDHNVQWPRLRNGPNDQLDNPCTDGVVFEDPQLGSLADHGGPTPTMMPAAGSVAVGLGAGCPPVDQRGEPRPAQGCAAGAMEP
jgi:hypothetical protein